MKKMLLILGILLTSVYPASAIDCGSFQCPQNPYDSGVSISNITGMNFFSEKIANIILTRQIKKDSEGKYKVNLQSYNLSALKSGKFKSLEITGENTVTDGIYASFIHLKTICDYNYIEVNNKLKTTTFKENFGMAYAVTFTEDDLNNTMNNSVYGEMIRKVNSIGNTYKLFNIVSSSAKITGNKLFYIMNISVPLLNIKKDIIVQTDMKVRNGEIILDDANVVTENFKFDVNKLAMIINYLNPLEFSMNLFDNKYADMQVKEININNNKVNVNGIITIDKDVVTPQ